MKNIDSSQTDYFPLLREHVSAAIKREFIEEAMNSNEDGAKQIDKLFHQADSVSVR